MYRTGGKRSAWTLREMGSPWVRGRRGDLAHPVESEISSQSTAVGATSRPWESQKNNKTGSVRHQDLIMHRLCIIVHISSLLTIIIVIVNNVLLDYLFQENKSYGSKKPIAFIFWCTRSRVEHSQCPCHSPTICLVFSSESTLKTCNVATEALKNLKLLLI